jgi:hypothetical protein
VTRATALAGPAQAAAGSIQGPGQAVAGPAQAAAGTAAGNGQPAPPSPIEPAEAEALDAYSRAVVAVADRLTPSVASLRVMRRTRRGQMPAGAGSAVVLTPDGYLLT